MPTVAAPSAAQSADDLDDVGPSVVGAQLRERGEAGFGIAAAEAPVQVGRDDGVALGREPFAHAQQLRLHAVAFHHDDHTGPRRR